MLSLPEKQFCAECRGIVEYSLRERTKRRFVKGKEYQYQTITAYCKECGAEIAIPGLQDKDMELFDAHYRKAEGLVSIMEIQSLMKKYNLGKAPLSLALGFGEITISRYIEGQMPSKKYSDIIRKALYNPKYIKELLDENRNKVGSGTYKKAFTAIQAEIKRNRATPKVQVVIYYILNELVEITPLALQKLLYFVQGLHLAFYEKPMFEDDCEAWIHGPVYPEVYNQYKRFGYNPIEDDAVLLKTINMGLSKDEEWVIDLVINSFGMYSGKILECITHNEEPWIIARGGIKSIEYSCNVIPKKVIGAYFTRMKEQYGLATHEQIMEYIHVRIKNK